MNDKNECCLGCKGNILLCTPRHYNKDGVLIDGEEPEGVYVQSLVEGGHGLLVCFDRMCLECTKTNYFHYPPDDVIIIENEE